MGCEGCARLRFGQALRGMENDLAQLASDLVRMDSRSFVSNIPVAERIEPDLAGFEVERLDELQRAVPLLARLLDE
jgi:hypothetical protein